MLNLIALVLGIIGSVICVIGTKAKDDRDKSILFLAGSVLLLAMALINGRPFFIGMEVLITCGCILQLTELPTATKARFWLLGSMAMVFGLFSIGEVRGLLDIIGMIGLLTLALGYATLKADIYMSASLVLASYCFAQLFYQGGADNFIFGALNIWFAQSAYEDSRSKRQVQTVSVSEVGDARDYAK
jgi:hypothetical protein